MAFACQQFPMSERQACKLVELDRSSYRYEPEAGPQHAIAGGVGCAGHAEASLWVSAIARITEQARLRGQRAQRVYRLYRTAGLMVRRLKRKRLTRVPVASDLMRSNQEWALDFVSDALATGRAIRTLTVVRMMPSREKAPFLRSRHEFVRAVE